MFFYFFIFLPLLATAQSGESAYTILRLPYSSHAAALGGNNISIIEDDITLAVHNPALLSNVTDNTLNLTYMTYMSDSKIAGAMFSKAFGERSTGAISARYIDYGKFDGYTEDNIFTGTFSAKDFEFSIMYSYLLSDRGSGGVTGKFIYSKYESMSSIALGVDLGVNYYNPDNEFSMSLAVKNLGGQVKAFEDKNERMPADLQAGFTKRLSHAPILISATLVNLHKWDSKDFYNADGSKDSFGELLLKHVILGADILIGQNFNLSLGYNYRIGKELSVDGSKWDGLTAGAGLHINKVKFGVSYSKLHVSSSSLLFNLSYSL
ncbi:MAG: type IX secretion system protein PorQ [Bacteroidaceae bacterium]|nr:type IX secretion system protein PorQ [Bacteroidaceae bacterium]